MADFDFVAIGCFEVAADFRDDAKARDAGGLIN